MPIDMWLKQVGGRGIVFFLSALAIATTAAGEGHRLVEAARGQDGQQVRALLQ